MFLDAAMEQNCNIFRWGLLCFMIDWGNGNTHLIFHRSNITSECQCRARGRKTDQQNNSFCTFQGNTATIKTRHVWCRPLVLCLLHLHTFSICSSTFMTQYITSKRLNRYLMRDSALLLPPLQAQRWNDNRTFCLWTFYTKQTSVHHEQAQNTREVTGRF